MLAVEMMTIWTGMLVNQESSVPSNFVAFVDEGLVV